MLKNEKLTIYFIKIWVPKEDGIRSGDSSFLIAPNGENLLLDCGSPSTYKQIIPLLKELKVKKIDNLLISHPHIDHLGSFPKIADEFKIGKVYRSKIECQFSKYYRAFEKACDKHKLDVVYIGEGDKLEFGNEIKINILNPVYPVKYPENYINNNIAFLNNESIVAQFIYGNSKVLFGGDLYKEGENLILEKYGNSIKSDIAKVNHHGDETSNSKKWIEVLKPQVVVDMDDGICSEIVYKDYMESGSNYYSTFSSGIVKVQVDKNHKVNVTTQFK